MENGKLFGLYFPFSIFHFPLAVVFQISKSRNAWQCDKQSENFIPIISETI